MKEYEIVVRIDNGYRCGCCYSSYTEEYIFYANNLKHLLEQFKEKFLKLLEQGEQYGEGVNIEDIFLIRNNGATKTDISCFTKDYNQVVEEFERQTKAEHKKSVEREKHNKDIQQSKNRINELKRKIAANSLEKELEKEQEKLRKLKEKNI